MIYVDRSRVKRPASLEPGGDSQAARELAEAREFYRGPRRQQRFTFRAYHNREVRHALADLFHGKCAYCETPIVGHAGDIENFRPKALVREAPEHPGYWWLAARWENLLLTCATCNRTKAERFPLKDEDDRAYQEGQEHLERPLLIDPCDPESRPEEHLVFLPNGEVASETQRGQMTISILSLNRPELRRERGRLAAAITAQLKDASSLKGRHLQEAISRLMDRLRDDQPYLALARAFAEREMDALAQPRRAKPADAARPPTFVAARRRRAKRALKAHQRAQSDYSLSNEHGRATAQSERRMIERITIRNVKAIRALDLELPLPSDSRVPWLMLLGENATGKSTVLQAVALTLVGVRELEHLRHERALDPGDYVRDRCKQGTVAVQISGFPKPHRLTFEKGKITLINPLDKRATIRFGETKRTASRSHEAPTMLLGYGATRLLPRKHKPKAVPSTKKASDAAFLRVSNLFDPFVPLFNAADWLVRRPQKAFDVIALILKDLLYLHEALELVKAKDRIEVKGDGARVPLSQLSDGYQSVLGLAVDILEVTLRYWRNPAEAEGIVLLDELGSHLHPTWRLRVVESLRRAFPAMQFIVSTHDPLCLRGLGKGEVVVMRRDEDRQIAAVTDLPSPGDFRVDQLLTSEFFGLNTTADPQTERVFNEYYALLAMNADTRSPEQEMRLAELRGELKDRRHLGDTLREQLMFEAIDALVAKQRSAPQRPIANLKQEAVDAVSRIWRETAPPEPETLS